MITIFYLLECAGNYFEKKGGIQEIIFKGVLCLAVFGIFMWCMCGAIDDLVARGV